MITTSTVEHGARLSISWALSTVSLTQLGKAAIAALRNDEAVTDLQLVALERTLRRELGGSNIQLIFARRLT